ncbi:hypothetical protein [Paeniglutamicibacter antarcticus]|uniref:Uncharacterized protein n=1 Tax=Paeniglutamicibacter antarcticus TaxID=494023 RepID=A0ABP9TLP1_9MICC
MEEQGIRLAGTLAPESSRLPRHCSSPGLLISWHPGESPTVPVDAPWVVTSAVFSFQDANHSLLLLAFRGGTR